MDLRSRTVHYYEVTMSSWTRTKGINNPSCCDLRDFLSRISSDAEGLDPRGNRGIGLELAKWRHDTRNGVFWALINRADANVSDITFKNLQTGRRRKGQKQREEGIEYSAHLLISPRDNGREALVIMTMGSGASMNTVHKMLTELDRHIFKTDANQDLNHFTHPSGERMENGDPKKYKVNYNFSVTAHKGEILEEALRTGKFSFMELVAHESKKFDAGGNLEVTRQTILVKPSPLKTITAAKLMGALRGHLKKTPGHRYKDVKVHYKTVAGKDASATLSVNDLDAAFTKKDAIYFDTDVEDQQIDFSPTIMTKMLLLPR